MDALRFFSMFFHGQSRDFLVNKSLLVVALALFSVEGLGQAIISKSTAGVFGNRASQKPSVSGDGELVLFISAANNLVSGDINGVKDAFLHNTVTGVTERISLGEVASQVTEPNADVIDAKISKDGKFAVFVTAANNIVDGDTNNCSDVFLRDLTANTTQKISVGLSGAQADAASGCVSISEDGTFIGFCSKATNLVAGDTNGKSDFFRYEVVDGVNDQLIRVSVSDTGVEGNGDVIQGTISDDGNKLAFTSYADNLVTADTNGAYDVFVRDVTASTTNLVNTSLSGVHGNGASAMGFISGDGEWVAFTTVSNNIVGGDSNFIRDAYLKNIGLGVDAGKVILLSRSKLLGQSNNRSYPTSISVNGRFVGFETLANNLDPDDSDIYKDAYIYDRQSSEIAFLDKTSVGVVGNSKSTATAVSADGSVVLIQSASSNLVSGDSNKNWDIFSFSNPLNKEVVSIVVSPSEPSEGDSINYTVSRETALPSALNVDLSYSGTAVEGPDVIGFGPSIEIPANQASVILTLNTVEDNVVESTESATVSIESNVNYFTVEDSDTATANILDDDAFGVSIAAIDAEISENPADSGTFRVSRTNGVLGDLQVQLSISSSAGLAENGMDYATLPASVTIPDGASFVDIEVVPIDDFLPEGDEAILIGLLPGAGYVPDSSVANLTIADDDKPSVFITSLNPIVVEGDSANPGVFRVERTTPIGEINVKLVYQGSASLGVDYLAPITTVTLPDGQLFQDIQVEAILDGVVENTETVIAKVLADNIYDLVEPNTATLLFVDASSKESVSIQVVQPNIAEDGSAPGQARFTRSGTAGNLTINYAVSGSATAGSDYQSLSGSVTIVDGQQSVILDVTGIEDSIAEVAETVVITIASGAGYTIDPIDDSATLLVQDNEFPIIEILREEDFVREGANNNLKFKVFRQGNLSSPTTIQVGLSGSADQVSDISFDTSQLTIGALEGEKTIEISVTEDQVTEGTESLVVTLSPSSSYSVGQRDEVHLAVLDALESLSNLKQDFSPLDGLGITPAGQTAYHRSGDGIFLWENTSETKLLALNDAEPNGIDLEPSISADGKYLVFSSSSTNYTLPTPSGFFEIYLRDLATKQTILLSQESSGATAVKHSRRPRISANGNFIVYESNADHIVSGDANGKKDIFLYDRVNFSTKKISTLNDADYVGSENSTISHDGAYVLFRAKYNTGGVEAHRLYKYDVATDSLTRVFSYIDDFQQYQIATDNLSRDVIFFTTSQKSFSDGGNSESEPTELPRVYFSVQQSFPKRILKTRIPGILEGRVVSLSVDSSGRYLAFLSDSGLIDPSSDTCNLVPMIYDRLLDDARRLFETNSANCLASQFSSIALAEDATKIRFSGLLKGASTRYEIFASTNPFLRSN